MFQSYFLNIGSIILGLIAWGLPILNISRKRKNALPIACLSAICCNISLYFQIVYTNYLVKKGDWSALDDTNWAVVLASAILLIGALIFNVYSLVLSKKKEKSNS